MIFCFYLVFFFFSSRRRHTRYWRDWSSDVCSSDLEYVEKVEGRFHPTALGTTVNDLLVASFDDLFNESYTARMEEELDEIEEGKLRWTEALREFYEKFAKDLKDAERQMRAAKQQAIPTEEKCENCGSQMVIK